MSDALALFRPEVANANNEQSFGKVLIHQPLGYGVAAILAGTLIVMVAAYSYFGTYTRKATVGGLLMPENGMLRLTSPTTGLLTEVFAFEGQTVKTGDDLFIISGERISATGGTQQLIADQLNKRLLILERNRTVANDRISGKIRLMDSRLAAISGELSQFSEEIRLIARRVDLAGIQHKRQKDLLTTGFISVAQFQQEEGELLALLGQQQSVQRARASLNREYTELHTLRQEAELHHRNEIADIDNGISLVRQEQAENNVRKQQVSTAPFPGTVTGVNIQVGQHVAPGTLLASLIPQGTDLTAHMYIASRQVGFVEKGQTVLIRYSAYPYQKFGMARGRIVDLAKSPYAVQELPSHIANIVQKTPEPTELFYRATVNLDSQTINVYGISQPLQAGMLLEADIIQDKRRIYEWALEPIHSITGKRAD